MTQLETTIKELKEDLQLLGYVASHDLKNPLRELQSTCQKLQTHISNDTSCHSCQPFVTSILSSASDLENYINVILEYSRISTGSTHMKPVDCNDIKNTVIEKLQPIIDKTHASINWDTLPIVTGKQTQLSRLFYYILHNALTYNISETPTVHISCATESDHTHTFAIRDNGIGIAPEYHEIIFILFQKLDTPVNYHGIGAGLALSKKIVQFHGGTIWLDSKPNEGTTIYFSLTS